MSETEILTVRKGRQEGLSAVNAQFMPKKVVVYGRISQNVIYHLVMLGSNVNIWRPGMVDQSVKKLFAWMPN